ncbi:SH3 domain-containing protein, partial [Helicobacter salomonis]|uniref:SH3 domain-containing protein n=2 Tax=Helicobacter salomonis TaxID=56878 RepID=UPI001B31CE32
KKTQPPAPSPAEPPATTYYVAVDVLNVRALPSIKARVTERLLRGREVHVLEIKSGWGRVKKGWVYLKLMSTTREE